MDADGDGVRARPCGRHQREDNPRPGPSTEFSAATWIASPGTIVSDATWPITLSWRCARRGHRVWRGSSCAAMRSISCPSEDSRAASRAALDNPG